MIYLKVEQGNKKVGMVTSQHFQPFDERKGLGKTESKLKEDGVLVESFPERLEYKEGHSVNLFGDVDKQEVWYEYVEREKTENELIDELRKDLDDSIIELSMAMSMMGADSDV